MFIKKRKDVPELDEQKAKEIMEAVKNNDKFKHITANWLIVLVAYYGLSGFVGALHALGIGFISALALSLFKEIRDKKASKADLIADFIGIGLALLCVWVAY